MNFLKPKYEINGKKYVTVKLIGEGAYAFVYRVRPAGLGEGSSAFALKKVICQTDEQLEEVRKEIDLLTNIKNENVLHLVASEVTMNKKSQLEALLLMPLYERSLQELIDEGPGYPSSTFRNDVMRFFNICRSFLNGLQGIHRYGYRHCDFKPANVLLRPCAGPSEEVVVTDLGSASPLVIEVKSRSQALTVQEAAAAICTAAYRAPELLDTPSHCTIDGKADVWAVGCTIYNMLYSRTPFESPVEGFSLLAACSGRFKIPLEEPFGQVAGRGRSSTAVGVVRCCLLPAAGARPALDQVIEMIERCSAAHLDSKDTGPACEEFLSRVSSHRPQPVMEPAPQGSLWGESNDRTRVDTIDSVDEFGEFESAAPIEPDDGRGGESEHPNDTTLATAPLQSLVLPSESSSTSVIGTSERDSFLSMSSVDLKVPIGKPVLQGPVFVIRRRGGLTNKMIRKMVWGVLTERGVLIRKTEDPSSKVHSYFPFHVDALSHEKLRISVVKSSRSEVVESPLPGEGNISGACSLPFFIELSSVVEGGNAAGDTSPGDVLRSSSVDNSNITSPGPFADSSGAKRRKSFFSLTSASSVASGAGGKRRGSTHMAAAPREPLPADPSSPLSNRSSNSGMTSLRFGLESASLMEEWFSSIKSIVSP